MVRRNWIDSLSKDAHDSLRAALQPREFELGAVIYNRAEQPRGLYLILSGSAQFLLEGPQGKFLLLKIIRENELFGETVAHDGKPAPISIKARSRLETGFVSFRRLAALRQDYLEIERGLTAAVAQNLRATLATLEELTLMDLRERAHKRLTALCAGNLRSREGPIKLDITQAELASMLGASRQATNAVLGEFEKAGWVQRHFRTIACLPAMPPIYKVTTA